MSCQHKQEKLDSRHCFLKVLSNIRFLAHQGLPFRGDGGEVDSNFIQLFHLRGEDNPMVLEWLKKKTCKYTSAEIQNEILKIMALEVLRQVAVNLQGASFYTIMVDETTDISNDEQVVLCLRWVDNTFDVHEEFVGLYKVESISSNSLVAVIKDTLLRLNLTLTKVRGQCYNGAANMAGSKSGVAKQLRGEEPRAVFTHCYGHALNLACGDAIKRCKTLRDALDSTHEITKLIKLSPRREAIFRGVKQSVTPESAGMRLLCPTRWTVRADALKSVLDNYTALQETWEEALEVAKDTETRARILGVAGQMKMFSFFYGVVLGELILRHCDNLSRTLQKTDISAAEGQEVAELTVKTLISIRSDDHFQIFWEKTSSHAQTLHVSDPHLPRQRKVPKRYETGRAEAEFPTSPYSHYRQIYYEGLDLIINCIKDRFEQEGYMVYQRVQNLLLKAARHEDITADLDFVTSFYGADFDSQRLKTQLEMYTEMLRGSDNTSLQSIISHMKTMSSAQKTLLSEVCTLTKLMLVMPATNAISERSFSALRLVKTYLRSTMTQERLNHLMVLYVHKYLTDNLDLISVANYFVSKSERRLTMFGRFQPSDLAKQ